MSEHIVVDATDLRDLARAARGARSDVDSVKTRAGNVMANLDRRGWNAGAAESAWNSAKGGITAISGALDQRAGDLDFRANLVDEFENGMYSGGMPTGFPLADPVNSYSGNLIHAEVDLALPTRGAIGLLLSRTYNSRDPRRGLFGVGWTSSLEWKVLSMPDGFVVVRCADGKRDRYDLAPDGTWVGDFGVHHHLAALDGGSLAVDARRDGGCSCPSMPRVISSPSPTATGTAITSNATALVERGGSVTGSAAGSSWSTAPKTVPRLARDSSGAEVGYVCDDAGRLVRVTDPTGAATSYAYDSDGRLATITDALGNTVLRNRFDARGRVLEQVDATGATSRFDYDDAEQLTTLTDARGATLRVYHDARGQVARAVDALGGEIVYSYTTCGNRASMRDRTGRLWQWEYDVDCRRTAVIDPLGNAERLAYDANDNLISRSDPLGNTWRFSYDDRGNLIEVVDPNGARTAAEVDAFGQLRQLLDPDGVATRFDHDEIGNLVEVATAVGSSRFVYDAAGRGWFSQTPTVTPMAPPTTRLGACSRTPTRWDRSAASSATHSATCCAWCLPTRRASRSSTTPRAGPSA